MTYDIKQRLRLPFQHHRRSLSAIRGSRGSVRQHLPPVGGLGPDDGYDWLQRIGRTRATRRWTPSKERQPALVRRPA